MNIQDIKDLLSKTSEIGSAIKKLPDGEFKDLLKSAVNDALESKGEKNEDDNLLYFAIFGYTPSFNDGDPCVHRYYTSALTRSRTIEYINQQGILEEISKNFALGSELENNLSDKTDEEIQRLIDEEGLSIDALQEFGYDDSFDGSKLNFILQKKLGTNFKAVARFSNNVITSVSYDYHECGY